MSRAMPSNAADSNAASKGERALSQTDSEPREAAKSKLATGTDTAIDICVVTYNSLPDLQPLVESLSALPRSGLVGSVCFFDNASKDGTVTRLHELVDKAGGPIADARIVESRRNLGFGRAHNRAASSGSAPYIFILNPDARLTAECLRRLLDSAAADPQGGAWEPRQVPYEHPKVYDPVTMEPGWCSGAGLLLRREAFERIGGFDPRIFLYCEDVDLSWRLREAGYRLRYVPSAILTHNTYSHAGEIKPTQFVYARLGSLYLRARFGRWGDVLSGLVMYCAEIFGSQHFPGQRGKLIIGLLRFIRSFLYFRLSGPRRRDGYEFLGWDFSAMRGGGFHPVCVAGDRAKQPKVSVLVRTIGRQPMLRRAMSSIANQTYRNIEVVLVEDGPSTLDEFLQTVPELEISYRALGRNLGRCEAGNEAMRLATGEYFVFLDEDDEFYADHIEQLVATTVESGRPVAYSTAFEVPTTYDSAHHITSEGPYEVVNQQPFSRLQLCHANYLPILAVMFHRRLFEDHGGLDPDLDRLEDWDLWLRYSAATGGFAFLNKTTSLYRVPADFDHEKDRRDEHGEYQALIRKKRRDDSMTMTIGEVADDLDTMIGDNQNIRQALGLSAQELRTIYEIYRRIGIFRWCVRAVIFAIRKLTGR